MADNLLLSVCRRAPLIHLRHMALYKYSLIYYDSNNYFTSVATPTTGQLSGRQPVTVLLIGCDAGILLPTL